MLNRNLGAMMVVFGALSIALVKSFTDPCNRYDTPKSCMQRGEDECGWCGNQSAVPSPNSSAVQGFCYTHSLGTCCDANNNDTFFCGNALFECNRDTTVCAKEIDQTTYGPCTTVQCCPADQALLCGGNCVSPIEHVCCNGGGLCNATQTCCGTADIGLACCDQGASCCSSPDGYAYWCCPAGNTCNENGSPLCNPLPVV
jgi:hypothetical protein